MKSNLLFALAAALAAASTAHAQPLPPPGGPGYGRESVNFGYADVLRVSTLSRHARSNSG